MNTQRLIENYLVSCKTWVLAKTLCDELGIDRRDLRSGGSCDVTGFTISGDRGYLYFKYASDQDFEDFYARIHSQAISSLERIGRLKRMRTPDRQEEFQPTLKNVMQLTV